MLHVQSWCACELFGAYGCVESWLARLVNLRDDATLARASELHVKVSINVLDFLLCIYAIIAFRFMIQIDTDDIVFVSSLVLVLATCMLFYEVSSSRGMHRRPSVKASLRGITDLRNLPLQIRMRIGTRYPPGSTLDSKRSKLSGRYAALPRSLHQTALARLVSVLS